MKIMKKSAWALLTSLIILFSVPVFANSKDTISSGIELRLIGHQDGQPIFLLQLGNDELDEFTITFKYGNGEILHTERVKTKYFTQKYRMNIDNLEEAGLRIEIKSSKNRKTEVFEIRKNSRMVEEISATKLS